MAALKRLGNEQGGRPCAGRSASQSSQPLPWRSPAAFAIAADGKRVYMVDQDGFIDGVFIDADTIDVCYREIKPASAVVSCNIVRRDK